MKNLIVIIFLFLGSYGFSQEINKTDERGKKQGPWEKAHENGVIRYKGTFKNDQPVGLFKHYDQLGNLNVKVYHVGKASYASIYYQTGELQAAGKYEDQLKDSTWIYYHRNGKKMQEEFYVNGKKEGDWKLYFDNGKIAEEKEYSQDLENGPWKTYYKNGQIKMKASYENGRVEGKQHYYSARGRTTIIGNVYHGARNGFWIYYNPDGTTKKKEEYRNGVRIDEEKDDEIIDDRNIEREKKDVLDFEDLHPPR